MPQSTSTSSRPGISPTLLLLGGALVIVSYFLHWGRVTQVQGGQSFYVKGGSVVLVAGIVGIIFGIFLWMVTSRAVRLFVSIVAIVGGLFAVAVGAVNAFSKDATRNTIADKLGDAQGVSHSVAERQLKRLEERGVIKTSVQLGSYFGLAGGALIFVGGIGGVSTARKLGSSAAPPVPGMPFQGTDQPTGGPLGAPPPPPGEPGPLPPEAGGTGTGPAPPLPPAGPPKPGEPGSAPGFQS